MAFEHLTMLGLSTAHRVAVSQGNATDVIFQEQRIAALDKEYAARMHHTEPQ